MYGAVSNFRPLYFGWELQLRGNFWQGPFSKDPLLENGTKSHNFTNLFFCDVTLRYSIKRNFRKRRLIVHNVDDIWCSDLVEMQKLSKWNKGYKYLLMVLDLFSKYGWIVPLKTKTGSEVSGAFETIFQQNKPKKLWVDKGKEYYNKNVKDLLAKNNIEFYSTENEEKSSVCERWNRTIKEKMYKRFSIQNSTVYNDISPKILASYNNSKK